MIQVNPPHSLGKLIQSVESSRGWTDREVSRRISEAGLEMSHSYIGKLRNQPLRSVTATMVRALAAGLSVPEHVVATAALNSMGVRIDIAYRGDLETAIACDPDLTEHDRRLLHVVVREMRADTEGTSAGRDALPSPTGTPADPHEVPEQGTSPRMSEVHGTVESSPREGIYEHAEHADLDTEPHAAAAPEDRKDDDRPV